MKKFHFAGVDIESLVRDFDAPIYIYDKSRIIARAQMLKASFQSSDKSKVKTHFRYACKANSNCQIMKVVGDEGIGIDACSLGEALLAKRVGFPLEKISLNSDNMTEWEIHQAMDEGFFLILGSLHNLESFLRKAEDHMEVGLRINTGYGAGHGPSVTTGGEFSKFGLSPEDLATALAMTKKQNIKIVEMHQHIGSGIKEVEPFVSAAKELLKICTELPNLKRVNLGGGVSIPYHDHEEEFDLKALAVRYHELIDSYNTEQSQSIELVLEPGRYLVADSGIFVASVTTVKQVGNRRYVGVNTGFNHLLRPAFYKCSHRVVNVSNIEGKKVKVDLVGNLCQAGDVFARDLELSETKPGEVIAFLDCGAYGQSMASNYNFRPLPAEILLDPETQGPQLIRKAQTIEDLINFQKEFMS